MAQPENRSPDDLSIILKRLMLLGHRATPESRRKMANDATTKGLLEAGLGLISDELAKAPVDASEERETEERPFFAWLSFRLVVDTAREKHLLYRPSINAIRERWPSKNDFVEDLLAYSLWRQHWSEHIELTQVANDFLADGDLVRAVHEVAYRDLVASANSRAYRISLMASAFTGRDQVVDQANQATDRALQDNWQNLYAGVMELLGLKLRPDISLREFTAMLVALENGMYMRMLTERDVPLLDRDQRRSLFGKAVLALIAGCIDPGNDESVEDAVRQISGQQEAP